MSFTKHQHYPMALFLLAAMLILAVCTASAFAQGGAAEEEVYTWHAPNFTDCLPAPEFITNATCAGRYRNVTCVNTAGDVVEDQHCWSTGEMRPQEWNYTDCDETRICPGENGSYCTKETNTCVCDPKWRGDWCDERVPWDWVAKPWGECTPSTTAQQCGNATRTRQVDCIQTETGAYATSQKVCVETPGLVQPEREETCVLSCLEGQVCTEFNTCICPPGSINTGEGCRAEPSENAASHLLTGVVGVAAAVVAIVVL